MNLQPRLPASSPPSLDLSPEVSPEDIFRALETAQAFFLEGLNSDEGALARSHLSEERRLSPVIVQEDGYGYVGSTRGALRDHMKSQGISLETAAEAGLLLRSHNAVRRAFRKQAGRDARSDDELSRFFMDHGRENPSFYYDYPLAKLADGKRAGGIWLTIPLRVFDQDQKPRIAGFQFRSMRPSEAIGKQGRYMSPRNTSILQWSDLIVGFPEEHEKIKRTGSVILCEGKFDQAAIRTALLDLPEEERPGVVALTGVEVRTSALAQLDATHATFFLDEDDTGAEAALKVGTQMASLGTHVSVAKVSDGVPPDIGPLKDPGDLLSEVGAEGILRALEQARGRGLATFAIEHLDQAVQTAVRSGQIWQRLLLLDRFQVILQALPAAVQRQALERIAGATTIPRSALEVAVDASKSPSDSELRRSPSRAR